MTLAKVDTLPGTPSPETSICWMVGLLGDLTYLTYCDGAHGCAVTK